jgi:drug/metabolite transporter (DMT)-like permease
MASILALLSSVLWGSADFVGGVLTKKHKAVAVTAVSQIFGLILGIFLVVITHAFIAPNLSWNGYLLPGIGSSIAGFLGLVVFYQGLATGSMGVVSSIGSLGALIPIAIAFINGERPSNLQIYGMVVALLGAFLASGPEVLKGASIRPILLGLTAMLCFGTALAFMAQGSKINSLLTMTTMRAFSVSIVILVSLIMRNFGNFGKKDLIPLIFMGTSDFLANLFLGIATTKGLVSIAMVLGSLVPIATALLAFKFLHERLHKVQYVGIFFAIAGVAFTSIS